MEPDARNFIDDILGKVRLKGVTAMIFAAVGRFPPGER